jgi:hypothetical protein
VLTCGRARRAAAVYSLSLTLLAATAAAQLCASVAFAAEILVINGDNIEEGFNDDEPRDPVGGNTGTTLGEQRLIAFQFAADLMEQVITSAVDINVEAKFDRLFCNMNGALLGSAGAGAYFRDFAGAPRAETWFPAALANKLASHDLDPTAPEINATFNSAIGTTCQYPNVWYYGLDGNAPDGELDLVTVILHELAHGLGFATIVSVATGAKGQGSGFDDAFMLHLEDHESGELYPDMTDDERVDASTNTGNLHWVGPAVVANGGFLQSGRDEQSGHVRMYAPADPEPFSSVSHWDTVLSPDELLEPTYTGPNHDVGLVADLFDDIGWNLIPATTTTAPPTTSTAPPTTSTTTTTAPAPTSTSTTTSTTEVKETTTTVLPSTTTTTAPTTTTTTLAPTTTTVPVTTTTEPEPTTTLAEPTTTLPPTTTTTAAQPTTTEPATSTSIPVTTTQPTTTTLNGVTTTTAHGVTTTTVIPLVCGNALIDGAITASDALVVLKAAVGTAECELCVCDVNDSHELTASDALIVLKAAVGLEAELDCPRCRPSHD